MPIMHVAVMWLLPVGTSSFRVGEDLIYKSPSPDLSAWLKDYEGDGKIIAQLQERASELCGGRRGDTFWGIVNESNVCSCQCTFETCKVTSCPPGTDKIDGDDTTKIKCEKTTIVIEEKTDPKNELVTCSDPNTKLVIRGSKAYCSRSTACPLYNGSPSSVVKVNHPESKDCTCDHEVECLDGHLTVNEPEQTAICEIPGKEGGRKETKVIVPAMEECPEGTERKVDNCVKKIAQCPTVVPVKSEVLGCGPHSDKYIKHLFDQLKIEMAAIKGKFDSKKMPLARDCVTNCVAIFAKFSECVEEDNATQCVGRAAMSGNGIVPLGDYGQKDKDKVSEVVQPPWLQKLSKGKQEKGAQLPCTHMYGSEFNFQQYGWDAACKYVETSALGKFVFIVGEYVNNPTGSLPCRSGFCSNVNSKLKGEKPHLSSCRNHCWDKYR